MGLLGSLLTFFGCNTSKDNRVIAIDSSGKVLTIDPRDILMTIPTIENTFPDFEDRSDADNLEIQEDDWRQVEFISKDQKSLIDQEIDSIAYIFAHEMHQDTGYAGFRKLHVRRLITVPLYVSFDRLSGMLAGTAREVAGITVNGNGGQVRNGFSLSSEGMNYYGLKDEKGNVVVFCLYSAESDAALSKSAGRISKFLAAEKLYMVDWVHLKIVDENNVEDFFEQKQNQ